MQRRRRPRPGTGRPAELSPPPIDRTRRQRLTPPRAGRRGRRRPAARPGRCGRRRRRRSVPRPGRPGRRGATRRAGGRRRDGGPHRRPAPPGPSRRRSTGVGRARPRAWCRPRRPSAARRSTGADAPPSRWTDGRTPRRRGPARRATAASQMTAGRTARPGLEHGAPRARPRAGLPTGQRSAGWRPGEGHRGRIAPAGRRRDRGWSRRAQLLRGAAHGGAGGGAVPVVRRRPGPTLDAHRASCHGSARRGRPSLSTGGR